MNRSLQPSRALLPLFLLAAQAAPASAATTGVTITKADCSRLVNYVPGPGVAYQPGRDVYGRPVAPADLNGGIRIKLPQTYTFDIEIQPLDRPIFNQTTLTVGTVTVDQDGRAYFDGQPLQDEEQAELSRRCQRVLAEGE